LCIDCGKPWKTVGVGGTTNVCSDCRTAYDRKSGRRIRIGIALFTLGVILQIVVAVVY
jgi:predicted nucleic acid-binding Zn ribbon protein